MCITVCCGSAEAQRPVGSPCARAEAVSGVFLHNCLYDLDHKSPKLLADTSRHHLSVRTWVGLPHCWVCKVGRRVRNTGSEGTADKRGL